MWFASRLTLLVASIAATTLAVPHQGGSHRSWLDGWYHWDVALYIKVAHFGYGGYPVHYPDSGIAAFFPGFPLALRGVDAVTGDWVIAGLVVSLVAGTVAAVALARLAVLDGAPGHLAVGALVVSPYAVFLAAGYSEALFLGFALPAWLAARRRNWLAAGVLTALASTVRVTGLFLALALVVQYVVTERRARPSAVFLALPIVPVGLFVVHLHAVIGDWLAWPHAESHVWGRHFTWPWTSLHHTWTGATGPGQPADYAWQFRADIVAVALGIALTLALIWLRRWGEATYVGLQVGALATSSYYLSVGRATLLWWPLWILLARAGARRPPVFLAYVAVAAPLMLASVIGFTAGDAWVG